MPDWTPIERALLLAVHHDLGQLIASPKYAIEGWRTSGRSSGGHGFNCKFTGSAIEATWHEFLEDRWREDGTPYVWRHGALLAEARITYGRLQRWAESLPEPVRAQAITWWRTYPEDTRNLVALSRLVLQVLAEPKPDAERDPADLLELLEMT